MAISFGSDRRKSRVGDKRAIELTRWFGTPLIHRNQHQQPRLGDDANDSIIEWTSHAWTLDELLSLYSQKLPVIVRAARGYYGQPGAMQLDVGQVRTIR